MGEAGELKPTQIPAIINIRGVVTGWSGMIMVCVKQTMKAANQGSTSSFFAFKVVYKVEIHQHT